MVRVIARDADVQVKRLSTTSLTCKMNSDGTKLGSYPLADNVEIIDTYEECTPVRIYPSRLAGVEFTGDMVRYYALNGNGEITHLILNDVTGDLHKYGIITNVTEINTVLPTGGYMISSSYTYDLNGQEMVFASDDTIYNMKSGPCQIKMEGDSTVERLYNLKERPLSAVSVSGNFGVASNGQQYAISEHVVVYVYENNDYQISNLNRVAGGDYTLTGWYDKNEKDGGCIRVIVAR